MEKKKSKVVAVDASIGLRKSIYGNDPFSSRQIYTKDDLPDFLSEPDLEYTNDSEKYAWRAKQQSYQSMPNVVIEGLNNYSYKQYIGADGNEYVNYKENEQGIPMIDQEEVTPISTTSLLNNFSLDISLYSSILLFCFTKNSTEIIPALIIPKESQEDEEYMITYINKKYEIVRVKPFLKKYIGVESMSLQRDCINTLFFNIGKEANNKPYYKKNTVGYYGSLHAHARPESTRREYLDGSAVHLMDMKIFKQEILDLILSYDISKDGVLLPGVSVLFVKHEREYEGTVLESNMNGIHGMSKILSITGEIVIVKNKDIKIIKNV